MGLASTRRDSKAQGASPEKMVTHEIDKAQRAVTRRQNMTTDGPLGLPKMFRAAAPGLAP